MQTESDAEREYAQEVRLWANENGGDIPALCEECGELFPLYQLEELEGLCSVCADVAELRDQGLERRWNSMQPIVPIGGFEG